MIDGLHLLRPDALWLLLIILPVIWLLVRSVRAAGSWRDAIDPHLLPHVLQSDAAEGRRANHWLVGLALALAVVAIAGPSFKKIDVPVFQRADALVIVLDLSVSMLVADVQPSRIQRARQKILDLLADRAEGVTGLVVYAGDAHVVAPLTDDRRTIENLLPALDPAIMPIPGSDSLQALRSASELLSAAGVANGNILLITDGMPKFEADDIRDDLVAANAQLQILGMGTEGGAPIPRPDGGFVRDDSGEIVVPTLDTTRLREIAAQLDGAFSPVTIDNSDLSRLQSINNLLEQNDIQLDRKTDTWLDQGNWLALVLALACLPLFRRGALAMLLILPFLQAPSAEADILDSLFQTPDQRGKAALDAGEAERAADLFERPDWAGTAHYEAGKWSAAAKQFAREDDADSHYNRGNALALDGSYEEAIAAYEKSLALSPDREDAIQNRDLIKQLLEESQQQQESGDGENDQGEEQDESQQQPQSEPGSESDQNDSQDNENPPNDSEDGASDSADSEGSENPSGKNQSQPQDQSSEPSTDEDNGGLNEEMNAALEEQTDAQMAKFDQALEEQQALEQWLRRVPDDPGGLLKRKFRYESIQRLRKGEEPDDDVRW